MKKIAYLVFYVFTFCFISTVNAQNHTLPKYTQSIVDSICGVDYIEKGFVNKGVSKQHRWFKALSDSCDIQQLQFLTRSANTRVQCYAFRAICDKDSALAYSVLLNHLTDTLAVKIHDYDILYSQITGDYFLSVYKLNTSQKISIDSMLMNGKKIRLRTKHDLIRDIKPEAQYYSRIKEIALTENEPIAVVALAKYHKPEDIGLIKALFNDPQKVYYGVYATREFPDTALYASLTHVFEKKWGQSAFNDYPEWSMLYQALAKYPTAETLELFEKTVKTPRNDQDTFCKHLYIAITKYPSRKFDPIKNNLNILPGMILDYEMDLERHTQY